MKHLGVEVFYGEDPLGPDPHGPTLYECFFCGRDVDLDHIRDFVKDVDGSMGEVCIDCVRHGVLDDFTPRGR